MEIAILPRDKPGDRTGYDGMPVDKSPWPGEGQELNLGLWTAWLETGVVPPTFLLLTAKCLESHTRTLDLVRECIKPSPDLDTVMHLKFGKLDTTITAGRIAAFDDIVLAYRAINDKVTAHDYDSHWGFKDQDAYGIFRVDLSAAEASELFAQPDDENNTSKKKWALDYHAMSQFTNAERTAWRGPAHIKPKRDRAIPDFAELQANMTER